MAPGVVGPGAEPAPPERLAGAVAPFGDREEIVIDLAVDEGIGVALPVERLGDVLHEGGRTVKRVSQAGPDRRAALAGAAASRGRNRWHGAAPSSALSET